MASEPKKRSSLVDVSPVVYTQASPQVRKTDEFHVWLSRLKDKRAVAKIVARIDRLALGNAGDVKAVGSGVSELRIDYGPGYRVYFTRSGAEIVLLLCGGDKTTQQADIDFAKQLASKL